MTLPLRRAPVRRRLTAAVAALTLGLAGPGLSAELTVENRVVTTPLHVFTVDDTGLPAQLEIRAAPTDLPLAFRAEKEQSAALLRRLGRGPQLTAPVRLEAVVAKTTVVAKAEAPATLQQTDQGAEAVATWQAGALKGRLRCVYAADGVMIGQVTCDSKGVALERLELVLTLSGPVDTAIAGNPAAAVAGKPLPPLYGSLSPEPGMLWSNGATPAGDGALHPGRVAHFFLGNGDRGFTWLANSADGFSLDDQTPAISVERNREGATVWRLALVNKTPRGGERTAAFTLLTHPARPRAPNRRREQWQPWTDKAATPALEAAARGTLPGTNLLVRADAGSVHETAAARALLAGPAGGDALAAAVTVADRFPLALFRYLAGTHTALTAQLRPDAAALTTSGAAPGPDRMALGRALLHDIGADLAGLANPVTAARVVRELEAFGCFSDDGQTEFLPYWRTAGILRYGEEFVTKDGFAVTAEDPTGRTRVSAFIRPDGTKRKALFVLVNEGTKATRGQFYVLQPSYFFSGFNTVFIEDIYSQLDFSRLPADGDWSRQRVVMTVPSFIPHLAGTELRKGMNPARVVPPLMDLESGGYVRLVERGDPAKKFGPAYAVKELFEVYGPVYVPPRGLRLLYGSGEPELPAGVALRAVKVAPDGTVTPLAVPVQIFGGTFKAAETPAAAEGRPLVAKVQLDQDGARRCPLAPGTYTVVPEIDGQPYLTRRVLDAKGEAWWPTVVVERGKWADCVLRTGDAVPDERPAPEK